MAKRGFPAHPHRGIETVTLVLDGELWHADNAAIAACSAPTTAESDYQNLTADKSLHLDDGRAHIRLVSGGLEGIVAPTSNHTPVQYLDLRLAAGGTSWVRRPAAAWW